MSVGKARHEEVALTVDNLLRLETLRDVPDKCDQMILDTQAASGDLAAGQKDGSVFKKRVQGQNSP